MGRVCGLTAVRQFLTYFYIEIHLESTKNNYPKKLRSESLKGKLKQARSS